MINLAKLIGKVVSTKYNQDFFKKWKDTILKLLKKNGKNIWDQNKTFKTKLDKTKKKILLPRDVPLPIWQNSYGPCKKLHYWGCFSPSKINARV